MTTMTAPYLNPAAHGPRPYLGDVGASRIGFTLMPDEARRIDDKLNDLRDIVTRIDTRLDMLVGTQTDHEKRLREVEERAPVGLKEQVASLAQWRAQAVGAAVLLSTALPIIVTLALRHLT